MLDPSVADILVVDDRPDNIRLLANMLCQHGYQVRKAISGSMALKAVAALPPDLILLDINMPDLDGYAVCQRLKQGEAAQRAVPVIFLSALNDMPGKIRAFEVGGVDYITKPFYVEEVLARVRNQLSLQQLQQAREDQNQQLRAALAALERTQAELVRKEKMLGLGKLVAGVAHEINNPIGFIASNLNPARNYVRDLLEIIALYQREYPQPAPEIADAIVAADLDFLQTDLHKLLDSMQSGAERIRNIVLALRIFARLDEAPLKTIDLHENLESALALFQHRLQDGERPVQVKRDYGELPTVQCYVRELNQVFFNLIDNALAALTADQRAEPQLWLRTRSEGDRACITIGDNGIGMDAATQARIFDPFFSNKPIGAGAGLGLSTSYQIVVEQHSGELACQSAPERGSEFTVKIPFRILNASSEPEATPT